MKITLEKELMEQYLGLEFRRGKNKKITNESYTIISIWLNDA